MITAASLHELTVKVLGRMARDEGIPGWHGMRKEELIQALMKTKQARRNSTAKASRSPAKPAASGSTKSTSAARKASPANGTRALSKSDRRTAAKPSEDPKRQRRVSRKIQKEHATREQQRDLSHGHDPPAKDRIVLMVRDAYWLHAYWELSRGAVERAKAAMAEHWHTARPVIRLLEVDTGSTTSTAERVVRDIEIHGGVRNWYIDVKDPPKSFRVDIGYLASGGKFHCLARSNSVETPRPGASESIDENWTDVAENCERIFAMSGGYSSESGNTELQELFEERLRRPMGSPLVTRFGVGAERVLNRQRDFFFEVDAEMIVYGMAKPGSYVTLGGEPVRLQSDGAFSVRLPLPDRRQVIPIVASSHDGMEQRTTVLAVERNTKVMEPQIRDPHA